MIPRPEANLRNRRLSRSLKRVESPQTLLRIGYGACLVIAIGSIGPWATLGFITVSGTDGDGVVTLILAAAAAAFLWRWSVVGKRSRLIAAAVAGALSLVITVSDTVNISNVVDGPLGLDPSVGWGLIVALIASIGVLAVSIRLMTLRPSVNPSAAASR